MFGEAKDLKKGGDGRCKWGCQKGMYGSGKGWESGPKGKYLGSLGTGKTGGRVAGIEGWQKKKHGARGGDVDPQQSKIGGSRGQRGLVTKSDKRVIGEVAVCSTENGWKNGGGEG